MAEFFANVGTSIGTSILVNAGTKEFSKVFNDAKNTHVIPTQAVKGSANPGGQVFLNGGAALGNLAIGAEQSLQNQFTSVFAAKPTTGVSNSNEAFNGQPHQFVDTGSGQLFIPAENSGQGGQGLPAQPQYVPAQPQYVPAQSQYVPAQPQYVLQLPNQPVVQLPTQSQFLYQPQYQVDTSQAAQGYNPVLNEQNFFTIQHPITGQDIVVSR